MHPQVVCRGSKEKRRPTRCGPGSRGPAPGETSQNFPSSLAVPGPPAAKNCAEGNSFWIVRGAGLQAGEGATGGKGVEEYPWPPGEERDPEGRVQEVRGQEKPCATRAVEEEGVTKLWIKTIVSPQATSASAAPQRLELFGSRWFGQNSPTLTKKTKTNHNKNHQPGLNLRPVARRRSFSREPDPPARSASSHRSAPQLRARRVQLPGGYPGTRERQPLGLPVATPHGYTHGPALGSSAAAAPPRPEAASSPPEADPGELGGAREQPIRRAPAYKPHVGGHAGEKAVLAGNSTPGWGRRGGKRMRRRYRGATSEPCQ